MKVLKLFIVSLLIMPLYLSAEDKVIDSVVNTEQEKDKTNNSKNNTTKELKNNDNVKVESSDSNLVSNKIFENSVQGSRSFVQDMLDTIYAELPKKHGNQEVFDYLFLMTTEKFAFVYMSKWVIGRDILKDVSEDLQQKYLRVSREFMILLYGEIFDTYYKQYIYKLGEVDRKSDTQYNITMRVEPKIQDSRTQDSILNVIWKVKYSAEENKFYVIDLDVNGIVFLTTQRKQFKDMLSSTGNDFNKFLELLEAKNLESKKRLGISM